LAESRSKPGNWFDVDPVEVLQCPADDSEKQIQMGGYSWVMGGALRPVSLTSYVPSAQVFGRKTPSGSLNVWNVAWDNASGEQKIDRIIDGTSNTIIEVEKPRITGESIVTAEAGFVNNINGKTDGCNLWAKTDIGPEAQGFFGCNCNDPGVTWDDEEGQWWLGDCTFTHNGVTRKFFQPPAKNRPREQQVIWNIYPIHAGGIVNALMADGSVRSITNNIDLYVWSALITPNGRETETVN